MPDLHELDTVFAKLTPSDLRAKVSFHALALAHASDSQKYVRQHQCHIASKRVYDREVALSQRLGCSSRTDDDDGDLTTTSTEFDTDNETSIADAGLVWTGWYPFDLRYPPHDPYAGWWYGRSKEADFHNPVRDKSSDVRGRHVIFNLDERTGYIKLFPRVSSTGKYEVTVDGVKLGRGERHLLNKGKMRLSFGGHAYDFEYMPFASTETFQAQRRNYMSDFLQISSRDFSLTPTPQRQSRTLGEWTICSSLGRGTFGKVYSATNPKGQLVAIKIVDRTSRTKKEVEREMKVMVELTKLAKSQSRSDSILYLRDVIYTNGHERFQGVHFEDVAYVFEQCAPSTFEELLRPVMDNYRRFGQTTEPTITVLQRCKEALQATQLLHTNGWFHRDLKLQNLGIFGGRTIILDHGGAMLLKPGTSAEPNPGEGGSINYMAPEKEMRAYNEAIDIWSLGVIFYIARLGHLPFNFSRNPWRPGNEKLRDDFDHQYRNALKRLQDVADTKWSKGLEDLTMQMLRFDIASPRNGGRIQIDEALKHPCWLALSDNERPFKKACS